MTDPTPDSDDLRGEPRPIVLSPAKPVKKADSVNETVKTVVYAVLIALLVRTFTFQPYNIPSGSMIPTLLVGDYLFASKFAYGYSRYSFPIDLPIFSGRILAQAPKQGDVVIFKLPKDNSTDYIKRLIGLPGDRLQVKHGQLYINDVAVPRRQIDDFVDTDIFGNEHHSRRFIETLPDGVEHPILQVGDEGRLDNTDVYTVPPHHYFMMGDNRTNSSDSRVLDLVGYVPEENLEAKAELIFFSLDEGTHFWEVWDWPVALRVSRMFNLVK